MYLFTRVPWIFPLFLFFLSSCTKENPPVSTGSIQLSSAKFGNASLLADNPVIPSSNELVLIFNVSIDPATNSAISVKDSDNNALPGNYQNLDQNKIISFRLQDSLIESEEYILVISDELKGINGETFAGFSVPFQVAAQPLKLISATVGEITLNENLKNTDIPFNEAFTLVFSHAISANILQSKIALVGRRNYNFNISDDGDNTYSLTPTEDLDDFEKINLLIPASIGEEINRPFSNISFELYTALDTTPKFPLISDEELLTLVQSQTFRYFWEFGHPVSGLARERNSSGDIVTSGGSGFGLMAMIVAVERGFITREEALVRWKKIFEFLKEADRFHGVWPHWLNGVTGTVQPFSDFDNGGDLVETAFLAQGMLTVRQYLDSTIPEEEELILLINELWESIEWNWYTKGGEEVLYWHWSPNFDWQMNLKIAGHNETQIVYVLAAASPNYAITPEVYHKGYARSGGMINGNSYYGISLPLGYSLGGPLFFAHYSYLGLDPRNLQDQYANYWEQNVNHSLINQAYCIANPNNFVGYSEECWGLTASDGNSGYSAHSPTNDRGVITPTAAISSIPYTPEASMEAIKHFYYRLGDRLWGEYGFYDAFNPTAGWYASSTLAIDQGPIICMIENFRTGLLWDLFMSAPEVKKGLDILDFAY